MYRLMQPSDWAEVLALWQAQRGDTEEFVRGAVRSFLVVSAFIMGGWITGTRAM
jgi:hypothetical protein